MSSNSTEAVSGKQPHPTLNLYAKHQLTSSSPFVQRVWLALELKDMHYQYIEVDPYKKPQSLLEVSPLGLVPALRHDDWSCHESTVLIEYVSFPSFPPFISLQN